MEYILIKKTEVEDFNLKVNRCLEEGWKLHGDTFVYQLNENIFYTQALIKDVHTIIPTNDHSVEQLIASWNA